jgi:hypothetical protein
MNEHENWTKNGRRKGRNHEITHSKNGKRNQLSTHSTKRIAGERPRVEQR